jgi:hypothetical protein
MLIAARKVLVLEFVRGEDLDQLGMFFPEEGV